MHREDAASVDRRGRRWSFGALRRGVLIAALVAVGSGLAAPVSAAQPYLEPLSDAGTEVISCGGFDARFTRSFTGTISVFVDGAGEPIRVLIVAHMVGSLENLSSGLTLPLRGDSIVAIDLADGTFAFTGNVLIGNRAGTGAVLKDVGRIVFDAADEIILWAGPHDLIAGGADALCAAVS